MGKGSDMAEGNKNIEATERPQSESGMEEDEMELETAMLAQKTIEIKFRADLPLDTAFVAQVPFIIGGIG
jgi:hypothetical protein